MNKKKPNRKQTEKQKRFALEYIVDFNGKQAAIRAGYSERTAEQQASRLLRNVKVSKLVRENIGKGTEKLEVDVDRILRELLAGAHLDPIDLFDDYGNLKPLSEIPAYARRAITCIDFYTQRRGEEAQPVCKLKLLDKAKCLELLGKYKAIWTEKHDLNHNANVTFKMVYQEPKEK
jgi:phage terminase small subunit